MLDEIALIGPDHAANDVDFDAWTKAAALIKAGNAGQLQGFKNRLVNGNFSINQRLAASCADDTYCHDRWYALTQSNALAPSTLTDPENGAPTGARLSQSNASAQRIGIAQIIESANCRDLRGAIASLAGRVRLSTSADVCYAVLAWTGAADAVTSDVVNDWASASYAAGGFFLGSNLSVVVVGEVACAANTWRTLNPISGAVSAGANNIIVMAWTKNTVAQNVTLDFNRMQLEPGAKATAFEVRPAAIELALCQRYFEKSFLQAVAPAQNAGLDGASGFVQGVGAAVNFVGGSIFFRVSKRAAPSVTLFNPSAANAQMHNSTIVADASAAGVFAIANGSCLIYATSAAGSAAGNFNAVQWTANAEL